MPDWAPLWVLTTCATPLIAAYLRLSRLSGNFSNKWRRPHASHTARDQLRDAWVPTHGVVRSQPDRHILRFTDGRRQIQSDESNVVPLPPPAASSEPTVPVGQPVHPCRLLNTNTS